MSEAIEAAVSTLNGVRHARDGGIVVPAGHGRHGACRTCGGRVSITAAQVMSERRRDALERAQVEASRARTAALPRYPACWCGGPLMLPEQAGKGPAPGRLFCGACGVQTGVTQKATTEQVDKARAAAKAEGFEVTT